MPLERLARKMVLLAVALSASLGRDVSNVFVRAYGAVFSCADASSNPVTGQESGGSTERERAAGERAGDATTTRLVGQRVDGERTETLLSDHGLSCAEVLDYCLLLAANMHHMGCIGGATVRAAIYWSVQLFLVMHKSKGMRLHAALAARGLVFSSPPSEVPSTSDVRTTCLRNERLHGMERRRTRRLWRQVRHAAKQLCAALSHPESYVLGGLYNDMVAKCKLPADLVAAATYSNLRRLVQTHCRRESFARALEQYVHTHLGGNRTHTLSVESGECGVSTDVSIVLADAGTSVHGASHARGTSESTIDGSRNHAIPTHAAVHSPRDVEAFASENQRVLLQALLQCADELVPSVRIGGEVSADAWTLRAARYLVHIPNHDERGSGTCSQTTGSQTTGSTTGSSTGSTTGSMSRCSALAHDAFDDLLV